MASHVDGPRRRRGVTHLSTLILAVGIAVPVGAQESLDVVDSLASAGRADEARAALESWWENQRVESDRRDRQRGLWLRGILTVDPRMAGLDFQRLVLEYPGGPHSDEALLRLGLISAAAGEVPRAARYFRTLVTDYPRSLQRRRAQEWLAENLVAIEEAELAAELELEAQAELAPRAADAEIREPEPAPSISVESLSTRYAVQVGAFESEERARILLVSVNASGFRARMVRVTGSLLVHVRVGAFLDRAEAVELMDRVRRRGHEATVAMDVAEEGPLR
jgi:cell division septation protein DedD